jgi:glutaredoxin
LTVVVVYTRPGCHLCEEAIEEIVAIRGEGREFDLHEVDIESEELLMKRMLERIPVVEVDGVAVSELSLDATGLRARLDTVRGDR